MRIPGAPTEMNAHPRSCNWKQRWVMRTDGKATTGQGLSLPCPPKLREGPAEVEHLIYADSLLAMPEEPAIPAFWPQLFCGISVGRGKAAKLMLLFMSSHLSTRARGALLPGFCLLPKPGSRTWPRGTGEKPLSAYITEVLLGKW